MKHNIAFDPAIAVAAPSLEVALIECDIVNAPTSDALWAEVEAASARIATGYTIEQIRHRPAINATRAAYKALGKEPNRYRPSAEALCWRAVQGKGLYRTLTVIDIVNIVSMLSGHSIGAFDADRIEGASLTLGVGRAGEPYEAIGRGLLNIESLPVYRDACGGIGTPTSDNERTALRPDTCHLLVTFNMYGESECGNREAVAMLADLLVRHAAATDLHTEYYRI